MIHLDDLIAQAIARRDVDLQTIACALGGLLLGEELVVRGQAGLALGLAGLGRHAHPLQLSLQGALAGGGVLFLLGQPGLLLFEPSGVVAFEGHALAVVQLEDPAGDVVEEVPVVGDRHDGAFVVGEEPLDPGDRFGVEVVGGLVEQQQVGALQ